MTQANTLRTKIQLVMEAMQSTPLHLPTSISHLVGVHAVMSGIDDSTFLQKIDLLLQNLCYAIIQDSESDAKNLFEVAYLLNNDPKLKLAPSGDLEAKTVLVMMGLIKLYDAYLVDANKRFLRVYTRACVECLAADAAMGEDEQSS